MLWQRLLRREIVTTMELGNRDLASIRGLLDASGLPTGDLEQSRIRFFGLHDGKGLAGVVGLELLGEAGLLRSLAVREDQRNSGLGTSLVREIETVAAEQNVRELFLLTTTAEAFFVRHGYLRRSRDDAPPAIKATSEFASLCPSSAAFMAKALPSASTKQGRQ